MEEGTPFYEEYGEGRHADELPDEETERKMYWRTKEILSKYGYERYEISNYAKPGYAFRHNIGYWERTEYSQILLLLPYDMFQEILHMYEYDPVSEVLYLL